MVLYHKTDMRGTNATSAKGDGRRSGPMRGRSAFHPTPDIGDLFGLCWNRSESAELGEPNRYFVAPTWTQRINRFARRAESGERLLILPPGWSPKIVREKSDFARRFNADLAVQPSAQKYLSSVLQKYVIWSRHPGSMVEGVLANRHRT
jgi:hypothetical protein